MLFLEKKGGLAFFLHKNSCNRWPPNSTNNPSTEDKTMLLLKIATYEIPVSLLCCPSGMTSPF